MIKTQQTIYLSRRNLLTLLAKLDRTLQGDPSNCTLIKYYNKGDPYPQTMDSCVVVAVEDAEYYQTRAPGAVHPKDDPGA